MARRIHQSAIEIYVEAYLSKFKKTNAIRRERPFIQKAINLIRWFLDVPCCDDAGATVTFARRDNTLTSFVALQLNTEGFDRRKNRKALERTVTLLENRLSDPCCD